MIFKDTWKLPSLRCFLRTNPIAVNEPPFGTGQVRWEEEPNLEAFQINWVVMLWSHQAIKCKMPSPYNSHPRPSRHCLPHSVHRRRQTEPPILHCLGSMCTEPAWQDWEQVTRSKCSVIQGASTPNCLCKLLLPQMPEISVCGLAT